jgi:uncharacterized protein (DUF58 family)
MNFDDDPRTIVWTLSARGGDLMVRMRAAEKHLTGLSLDLRTEAGDTFEKAVSTLASLVYETPGAEGDNVALTIFDHQGRRKIYGRHRVLDCLAMAEPLGRESRSA